MLSALNNTLGNGAKTRRVSAPPVPTTKGALVAGILDVTCGAKLNDEFPAGGSEHEVHRLSSNAYPYAVGRGAAFATLRADEKIRLSTNHGKTTSRIQAINGFLIRR